MNSNDFFFNRSSESPPAVLGAEATGVVVAPVVGGEVVINLADGARVFKVLRSAAITNITILGASVGFASSFLVEFETDISDYAVDVPWTWRNGIPIFSSVPGKRDLAVIYSIDGEALYGAMWDQGY